jgi:hypothetical protein
VRHGSIRRGRTVYSDAAWTVAVTRSVGRERRANPRCDAAQLAQRWISTCSLANTRRAPLLTTFEDTWRLRASPIVLSLVLQLLAFPLRCKQRWQTAVLGFRVKSIDSHLVLNVACRLGVASHGRRAWAGVDCTQCNTQQASEVASARIPAWHSNLIG